MKKRKQKCQDQESSCSSPGCIVHFNEESFTPSGIQQECNSVTSNSGKAKSNNTNSTSHNSNSTTSRSISTESGSGKNIWSILTQRGYLASQKDAFCTFDEDEDVDNLSTDELSRWYFFENVKYFFHGVRFELKHRLKTIWSFPYIIFYAVLVFIALVTMSLVTINLTSDNIQQNINFDAKLQAIQTASYFADAFAKTLIPLRSLQQAISHSEKFKDLPHRIGNYGEESSASSVNSDIFRKVGTDYRNVKGICDEPELISEFQDIVEGINRNFGFEDIIIAYRMAPYGVYCLANPLTVELTYNKTLNLQTEIGWDPIHSENKKMNKMLRSIYHEENSISMFGPFASFMDIPGLNIYCGHLAVEIPGYNYILDGKSKSIWGFVMHFVDWSKLKERSGIDAYYKEKEYSFQLSRTDLVVDKTTGISSHKDVIIAASKEWPEGHKHFSSNGELFNDSNSVSATIETQDSGDWTMRVKTYTDVRSDFLYAKVTVVITIFIFACMIVANLTEKKLNKLLLYKIMPMDAVKKLKRGQTVIERYNIVTIFFSDIVGFTSMVGEMRPIQVMKMLNELYMQFDKIAEKHGVYKVETIGDAYMVVGGAPHRIPAPEAAEKVALFAIEAMEFVKTFRTTDGDRVTIRAGIASGPAVAGVVGKTMPRYCFFGDTVNLASRMESNSIKLNIQCSNFTSCLLHAAPNFEFLVERRKEMVNLKGKGDTETWWIRSVVASRQSSISNDCGDLENARNPSKDAFLQSMTLSQQNWDRLGQPDSALVAATSKMKTMTFRIASILELRLSIALNRGSSGRKITDVVKKELKNYVEEICSGYNDRHFHAFEHASHVTISMNKIVDLLQKADGNSKSRVMEDSMYYFLLVFACLIHDVGHTGMTNANLMEMNHKLSKKYSQSQAEMNSIDVSLELLSKRKYKHLHKVIYNDIMSKEKFQELLHWAVLSTDIALDELRDGCSERYEAEYPVICPVSTVENQGEIEWLVKESSTLSLGSCSRDRERVAIEHIMQVADIAHTMQSWKNFVKWNLKLFKECMFRYEKDLTSDPSPGWYEGQVQFLINYVIPLAKRMEYIFDDIDGMNSLKLSKNAEGNLKRWKEEGHVISAIFRNGHINHDLASDILINCFANFDD